MKKITFLLMGCAALFLAGCDSMNHEYNNNTDPNNANAHPATVAPSPSTTGNSATGP